MKATTLAVLGVTGLCLLAGAALARDITTTIITNADAVVDVSCYTGNDYGSSGTGTGLKSGDTDHFRKSYIHFAVSVEHPGLGIRSAYYKMDHPATGFESNSGAKMMYAIMDKSKDWDLSVVPENALRSGNAPEYDAGLPPTAHWYFLEEGTGYAAVTREVGGFDNTSVALDVAGLIKWQLGNDPSYSQFSPTDSELTFCFEPKTVVKYIYTAWASKEYTPSDPSDAPRLEITQWLWDGDLNYDGRVDFTDYQILEANFGTTTGATWDIGDIGGDGAVTFTDYQTLEAYFGSSGVPVPEPSALALLAMGALAGLKRRRRDHRPWLTA